MHCAVFAVHGSEGPFTPLGCDAGFETGCTHAPAPACPLPLLAYTKPLSCVAQTTLTQGGVDLTVGSLLSRTTLSDRSFGSLLWIAHSDTLFGCDLSVESFSRSSVGSLIRTAHSDRSFGSLRRIAHFTFGSLLYKKFDPPFAFESTAPTCMMFPRQLQLNWEEGVLSKVAKPRNSCKTRGSRRERNNYVLGGMPGAAFSDFKKVSFRRRSLFAFLNLIVNRIFKLFHPKWALGW